LNSDYIAAFEEKIARALRRSLQIVAAYEMNDKRAFPGSLAGVIGVVLDPTCPRDQFREIQRDGRTLYAACGYPRDIPGVPPEYNLHGISFAVANVAGFLAAKTALSKIV
jgi:hypothetical protein